MTIEVNISKDGVEVATLKEPLQIDNMPNLLSALKNAKTKTNEVLTELVEADKKAGVVPKEIVTKSQDEVNDDDPVDDEDDQV